MTASAVTTRALRTPAEIEAAGTALGAAMPPLSQEQADLIDALLGDSIADGAAA